MPWADPTPYSPVIYITTDDVTIRNCEIKYIGDKNRTAGIFVYQKHTDITIEKNIIDVSVEGNGAVQAVGFSVFDPSIRIVDNELTANYGVSAPGLKRTTPYDGPASAIYIGRVYELATTSLEVEFTTPIVNISGNKLSYGNPINTAGYSFYFNAFPQEGTTVTKAGVDYLRKAKFCTPDTVWAYGDKIGGFHRVLLDALVENCGDRGFGGVLQAVNLGSQVVFEVEHYEISGGKIKTVSCYGDKITGDEYTGPDVYYGMINNLATGAFTAGEFAIYYEVLDTTGP
jgi:hypothetical protein